MDALEKLGYIKITMKENDKKRYRLLLEYALVGAITLYELSESDKAKDEHLEVRNLIKELIDKLEDKNERK